MWSCGVFLFSRCSVFLFSGRTYGHTASLKLMTTYSVGFLMGQIDSGVVYDPLGKIHSPASIANVIYTPNLFLYHILKSDVRTARMK